jgi:hypothetical protein
VQEHLCSGPESKLSVLLLVYFVLYATASMNFCCVWNDWQHQYSCSSVEIECVVSVLQGDADSALDRLWAKKKAKLGQ